MRRRSAGSAIAPRLITLKPANARVAARVRKIPNASAVSLLPYSYRIDLQSQCQPSSPMLSFAENRRSKQAIGPGLMFRVGAFSWIELGVRLGGSRGAVAIHSPAQGPVEPAGPDPEPGGAQKPAIFSYPRRNYMEPYRLESSEGER